jgi:hypothetical protein
MSEDWRPRFTKGQKEKFKRLQKDGESDKTTMERLLIKAERYEAQA